MVNACSPIRLYIADFSIAALKHSPSRKKNASVRHRPPPSSGEGRSSEDTTFAAGSASGRSELPASSTPPPSFEEAIREPLGLTKQRSNTDPVVAHLSERTRTKMSASSVASAHSDRSDAVSISHITLKTESTLSTQSITSESSSTTSGISSTIRTATWTPPHSVEGSTPTHTEGTPSFTESSSSGDLGCPTTPVRGIVAKEANVRSTEPLPYQETEMTHL